jgi:hypothetical protein
MRTCTRICTTVHRATKKPYVLEGLTYFKLAVKISIVFFMFVI